MKLVPIKINPGIVKDTTEYSAGGSWVDSNLIRFRMGYPESWGGWTQINSSAFTGTARTVLQYSTYTGSIYYAIGTSRRFYTLLGEDLTELTPLRATSAALTDPFATTNTLSIVTVTHASHGASVGDEILVSGTSTFNGVLAASFNTYHTILTAPTANTYTIDTGDVATATGSGGGAAAVTIKYLIVVGAEGSTFGTGWGASTWSRGAWGSAVDLSSAVGGGQLAIWSISSYAGEDLIISPRNGAIYYWDATNATTRPVEIGTLGGATVTPDICTKVMVSSFDGHVIAFGVNAEGVATINPMLIRWSDSESAVVWTVSSTTSAGNKLLSNGSKIVTAVQSGKDIIIFTDTALISMTWVGGNNVYAFDQIAEGIDIGGPNSAVLFRDNLYWIGTAGFYTLTGSATDVNRSVDIVEIPCPVQEYISKDINWDNRDKIYCGTNHSNNEVIWFYPSNDSDDSENDKYVVYNVVENLWYYGSLSRTTWNDFFYATTPVAAASDGYLYQHDDGFDDGSTSPVTAMNSYIESSPFDDGDNGNGFITINRILHDITFRGSGTLGRNVTVTLTAKDYPGETDHSSTEITTTRTVILPVETYTKQHHIRIRGRQFKIRIESNSVGSSWRLGTPRLELRTDGRR